MGEFGIAPMLAVGIPNGDLALSHSELSLCSVREFLIVWMLCQILDFVHGL